MLNCQLERESISVSIKLHCARALAGMKWHSSVNFTGASIICNRLGSDFLPSYYFGKLPLRSIRLRTTVFSVYSIYYRLKIEEHCLGFKRWHYHYKKVFQDFFYLAGMFHFLVFLRDNMKNCMYYREAITFELNVLFAQLPPPLFSLLTIFHNIMPRLFKHQLFVER